MKNTILLLCLIIAFAVHGQEKGLYMIKKSSKRVEFLSENKRVRIKTTDGKRMLGRFQILDDKTILIDKKVVLIESIKKVRYRPLGLSILSTTIKTAGATVAGMGVVLLSVNTKNTDNSHSEHGNEGNFIAPLLIGVGAFYYGIGALLHTPFNSHKNSRWNYQLSIPQDSIAKSVVR
ncbi:hypothetical protein FFWV33_05405 [Flavobacterium faecale]|uniref:Uncharacterized protein n=1 Tax=Flavobacterium faecale TaxID=1355330 RepID=A0A2S1LBB1_9FLAO|nr:hypothetical protein [Flavobacterium faecale]AWG21012.1 hypothetical protein FFWV33_05405 [Flavobacterium faecale]